MLSNTVLFISLIALGSPVPSTSDQALTVLQENCGNENCHGGPDAYRFDVGHPSTMIEAGVVKPGRAADSEVIRRVEAGIMPASGSSLFSSAFVAHRENPAKIVGASGFEPPTLRPPV